MSEATANISRETNVSETQLVRYDAMRSAIAAAYSIDEVKEIRNKARALEEYARQANDRDLERQVRDIRIRAEKKAGELLSGREMAKGSAQPGLGRRGMRSDDMTALPQQNLAEIGITKNQSSEWQKLAAVPEPEFEEALADPAWSPTTTGIIARHEAKTRPPVDPLNIRIDPMALWLWGRLKDFEREGLLAADPNDLFGPMPAHMKKTTLELAPQVAAWLRRLPA